LALAAAVRCWGRSWRNTVTAGQGWPPAAGRRSDGARVMMLVDVAEAHQMDQSKAQRQEMNFVKFSIPAIYCYKLSELPEHINQQTFLDLFISVVD